MPDKTDPAEYVLYLDDLSVSYTLKGAEIRAVTNVTLGVREHESVGIVGESGCGKSTLAMAIAHILPQNSRITGGRIYYKGNVIADSGTGASYSFRMNRRERALEEKLNSIRWFGISIVFQGAINSLNPLFTVGEQMSDIFYYRLSDDREVARQKSRKLLSIVGLESWVMDAFPHQLSGGMKQRVIIAMAIALKPALIIADEPTTSLDVITQYKIVEELEKLRNEYNLSIINISHDISLVSHLSDRIQVMYAGRIIEALPESRFANVQHPYTRALIDSMPSLTEDVTNIESIPGAPPSLMGEIAGCAFAPRCAFARLECSSSSTELDSIVGKDHYVRCNVLPFRSGAAARKTTGQAADATTINSSDERKHLLSASGIRRVFKSKQGIRIGLKSTAASMDIVAANDISLELREGDTVGLVGETGSGKTTFSRIVGLLDEPTSGKLELMGAEINFSDRKSLTSFRPVVQTIFQDPFQSLNPRHSVQKLVAEPLEIHSPEMTDDERRHAVERMLVTVGLTPSSDYINKFPHQLSGGQRQRVAIARNLILNPKLVVADEPISMLDVSLRAGVLNLLRKMKEMSNMSMLYITHDIASARYISDRIMVIYKGQIVEEGTSDEVTQTPVHPYSVALVLASIGMEGNLSESLGENIFSESPAKAENMCKFAPRCPLARDICLSSMPDPVEFSPGRKARCHFAGEIYSNLYAKGYVTSRDLTSAFKGLAASASGIPQPRTTETALKPED